MKPDFPFCQPHPFGSRYEQQQGGYLPGYSSGLGAGGNGPNLYSACETSGHPSETSLPPKVSLPGIDPALGACPVWGHLFPFSMPWRNPLEFPSAWIPLPNTCVCAVSLVTQSRPTLSDPMDCSPPGSSVHGILQARILEWVVIPVSRGSSRRPRDRTQVPCVVGGFCTAEPPVPVERNGNNLHCP